MKQKILRFFFSKKKKNLEKHVLATISTNPRGNTREKLFAFPINR